jgi:nucleotide-binding universal stress UspA family protein
MSTLREVLEGTEYKAALDAKAEKVLSYYKGVIEALGHGSRVKTVIRSGQPAEEILKLAEEEKVDIIFVGSTGKQRWSSDMLIMGSVSREVANLAKCPVLIMK